MDVTTILRKTCISCCQELENLKLISIIKQRGRPQLNMHPTENNMCYEHFHIKSFMRTYNIASDKWNSTQCIIKSKQSPLIYIKLLECYGNLNTSQSVIGELILSGIHYCCYRKQRVPIADWLILKQGKYLNNQHGITLNFIDKTYCKFTWYEKHYYRTNHQTNLLRLAAKVSSLWTCSWQIK